MDLLLLYVLLATAWSHVFDHLNGDRIALFRLCDWYLISLWNSSWSQISCSRSGL